MVHQVDDFAAQLRLMRTHGVENVIEPKKWNRLGFNFRFTDVLASIGLEQFKKLDKRLNRFRQIYEIYSEGLASVESVELIQVSIDEGEVGPYIEILCQDRERLVDHLHSSDIETRNFYPDLADAEYFSSPPENKNSKRFERQGLYLPSGPSLTDTQIERVLDAISTNG